MKFNTKDHPRHFLEKKRYVENKTVCNLCEEEIDSGFYLSRKKIIDSGSKNYCRTSIFYCLTCHSHFHESCLTIDEPDVHDHSLFFIRRQTSVVCNVCGLVGTDKINMYACVPCDLFIHRNCIFLPKVLKITRHLHRLFRISITGGKVCKICQESVSEYYEGYTCRERCDYVAHAFCATRSEVWDKRVPRGSLECVSSELNDDHIEIEGIAIHHFSHNHKLTRLHGDAAQVKMGGQVCQSCILPIDMGSFLYCKQCGFSLHDTCGRLPRRIEHMLHRHPLILEGIRRKIKEGVFTCSVCNQDSCGFMYRCYIDDCEFYMDVKCASFVEAFNHTAHQHPLFLEQRFDIGSSNPYKCMACGLSSTIIAVCSDPHCHFSLDLKCATLPGQLLKCSYDSHPLTLSLARIDDVHNGTPTSSLWCEMCEEKIKKTNLLIYMCNACCTTVHVECILGRHRYIKTGHKIEINGAEVDIVSNKGSADSWYCHECQRLCQGELVFIRRYNGRCFCSTKCLRSFFDTRLLPPNEADTPLLLPNEALARFKKTYERIGNRI